MQARCVVVLALALIWISAHAQSIFTVVPTPNGNHGVRNNSLSSVTASSPSDIWAVGQSTIHYDGTTWKAFNAPMILGDNTSDLTGVADISPIEAWAVGYIHAGEANPGQIIEQWNGTQWNVYSGPTFNPGDQPELWGIAAVAPNNIWAVGSLLTGSVQSLEALFEHWDGTAWTAQAGHFYGFFQGVSADAEDDIWAVGYSNNVTFSEHYDGTRWNLVLRELRNVLERATIMAGEGLIF